MSISFWNSTDVYHSQPIFWSELPWLYHVIYTNFIGLFLRVVCFLGNFLIFSNGMHRITQDHTKGRDWRDSSTWETAYGMAPPLIWQDESDRIPNGKHEAYTITLYQDGKRDGMVSDDDLWFSAGQLLPYWRSCRSHRSQMWSFGVHLERPIASLAGLSGVPNWVAVCGFSSFMAGKSLVWGDFPWLHGIDWSQSTDF